MYRDKPGAETDTMGEHEHRQDEQLTATDAAAIDRLFENGFEHGLGHPKTEPGTDDRAVRAASILALLGTPVEGESDRSARVDLAVVRSRKVSDAPALSEADADAVDRWVDHEETTDADRAARIEALAALATAGPASDAGSRASLIERTMQAVESDARQRERRMRIEQGPELRGWRMRLADVVSVAAMLLLCASVALPMFGGIRQRQQRLACLDNMRSSATAFGAYAGDHADRLPMATAGFGGGSWMDVGTRGKSNSENLYTVVRTGYESLDDLACASNPHAARGEPEPGAWDWRSMDEISYSYRIMGKNGMRLSLSVPTTVSVVVATDRSPVTLRASRGQVIYPEANTPNHAGRGQYVLRLDGSSVWTKSPVLENGDNMWLPRPIEAAIHQFRTDMGLIQGTEMPESETDAFVGP